MNIAFIHEIFPGGGAEKVTLGLAKYLSRISGNKCFVYCNLIDNELMDDSIDSVLEVKQIAKTRNVLVKGYKAYRLLKKDKIDIAVQVSFKLRDIEILQKMTGIKVVLANHGNTFWHKDIIEADLKKHPDIYKKESDRIGVKDISNLAELLTKERFAQWYDTCDAYVVLCDSYKKKFEDGIGIQPADSHVYSIENAQEAVPEVNYEKEKIILYCGRLSPEKRVEDLLVIWSSVQDKLPDYRLIILGSGNEEEKLKQLALELKLERTEFKGHVMDPGQYYQKASISCLTSRREGWPLALTEAQAYGCIPVAYECTEGVSDILDSASDGVCGFKVKSGDTRAFAERLLAVASMTEEERLEIRKNAVRKRMRYVPEIQSKKWEDLFKYLLKDKR